MSKNVKRTYLMLWILLAVALLVVLGISFLGDVKVGTYQLSKGTFPEVILKPELTAEEEAALEAAEEAESGNGKREIIAQPDSTVKTVFIFGDSMTILIANRLAAYGEKNGYKVVSVTWDGSSTVSWSACDTIDNIIARYHPDFIMVSLGSNELFLKNFDLRKPNVEKIIKKFKGIPFVWISPPNWKEDVGFNAMMRKTLPPGTFYNSNNLDLPRGPDHIHPTPKGGVTWTDSIMSWMPYTPHPIPFARPDRPGTATPYKSFYYRAGGGKGDSGNGSKETSASEDDAPAATPSASEPEGQSQSQPQPSHEAPAQEAPKPAAPQPEEP